MEHHWKKHSKSVLVVHRVSTSVTDNEKPEELSEVSPDRADGV